jgi:pyridoxine 5-phosphate synthase
MATRHPATHTNLSVNLNKVALLRNSRGGPRPDPLHIARLSIEAGAEGVTLHPRADARHATLEDVLAFAELEAIRDGRVELNVEGDLRPELMRTALAAKAHQFTIVPVMPGEITSTRGWRADDDQATLHRAVAFFAGGPRLALFVDAEPESVRLAAAAGVHAVELYTGPYATSFGSDDASHQLDALVAAAELARSLGLRVNGGHDLDTVNLPDFIARVRPDEVSIGHALISDALEQGWQATVRAYRAAIAIGHRADAAK